MFAIGNALIALSRTPNLDQAFTGAMPLGEKLSPAIRDARRELFTKVRNDWSYPEISATNSSPGDSTQSDHLVNSAFDESQFTEWRERTYASSDPSSDEDGDNDLAHAETQGGSLHSTPTTASFPPQTSSAPISILRSSARPPVHSPTSPTSPTSPSTRRIKKPHLFARTLLRHSPSRSRSSDNSTGSPRGSTDRVQIAGSPCASPLGAHFEAEGAGSSGTASQDHQAHEVAEHYAVYSQEDSLRIQKDKRKQRRMKRFEEELSWNDGLRYWAERRDAWTCARKVDANEREESNVSRSAVQAGSGHADSQSATHTGDYDPGTETETTNATVSEHEDVSIQQAENVPEVTAHSTLDTTTPNTIHHTRKTILPLPPPLLPNTDPTRATFDPKTQSYTSPYTLFPSIYSKVVLQSLTPSVPINLSTLIGALIDGWKRDGEWPPKSDLNGGVGNGGAGSRQSRLNGDVKRRGRKGGDVESRLVKAGLMSLEEREALDSGKEGRIKRGVERVKRGLGIGGE